MTLDSNKVYTCIQKCPELDDEGITHCHFTGDYIKRRKSIDEDFCPCGNIEIWKEMED